MRTCAKDASPSRRRGLPAQPGSRSKCRGTWQASPIVMAGSHSAKGDTTAWLRRARHSFSPRASVRTCAKDPSPQPAAGPAPPAGQPRQVQGYLAGIVNGDGWLPPGQGKHYRLAAQGPAQLLAQSIGVHLRQGRFPVAAGPAPPAGQPQQVQGYLAGIVNGDGWLPPGQGKHYRLAAQGPAQLLAQSIGVHLLQGRFPGPAAGSARPAGQPWPAAPCRCMPWQYLPTGRKRPNRLLQKVI